MSREEICTLRASLGLTQEAFAMRIGVTVFQVSRWECGRQSPSRLATKVLQALVDSRNSSSKKSRKLKRAS